MNRRILYIQYTNPAGYPPLEHSARILADRGWHIQFLGRDIEGVEDLVFPAHPRISIRCLPPVKNGWARKIHYIRYMLWCFGRTIIQRPHWVYASDVFSCPIAWLCSLIPGVNVLYHEHDAPPTEAVSGFMNSVLQWRGRLARRALACIVPNERRLAHFLEDTRTTSAAMCVWNCPLKAEVFPSREAAVPGTLRLFYHGSIVPDRLPFSVILALSFLPEAVRLSVAGYETVGHPGYIQALKNKAAETGLADRVTFIGTVPDRKSLLAHCAEHDVGLAFMPAETEDFNLRTMTGASNKPFDYLACGLALLVSDLPDWKEMFTVSGYGRACNIDDPESVAEALQWYLAHPDNMRSMGEAGRQRILNAWNYEDQFTPVLQMLENQAAQMPAS